MEKFLGCLAFSALIASGVTPVADYMLNQHWNFFIVWLVVFFMMYCGEWILD